MRREQSDLHECARSVVPLSLPEKASLIATLAAQERIPPQSLLEAARQLGIHERSVQRLVKRFRDLGGSPEAVMPRASNGGRGKGRLEPEVENLIQECLRSMDVSAPESLVTKIRLLCHEQGLRPPSRNTIRRRLQATCAFLASSRKEDKEK